MFLGNAFLDKDKPDDAIAYYKKAITLQQDHVVAHNNLGIALYKRDKYVDAIEEFKKVIDIDGSFVEAYYNYGRAITKLYKNNQPDQVSEEIRKYKSVIQQVIKENSKLALGYCLSGIAYLKIDRPQDAIKDFEQFEHHRTDIKPADCYYDWGNALLKGAKQKAVSFPEAQIYRHKAISKYEKAINLDERYYDAYYNLSVAHAILSERDPQKPLTDKEKANLDYNFTKAKEYYNTWEVKRKQPQSNEKPQNRLTAALFKKTEKLSPAVEAKPVSPLLSYSRVLPWAVALAALGIGLLVIFLKRNCDSTVTPTGESTTIPSAEPVTPVIDDALNPEDKHAILQRRTQVGGYFPSPGPRRPTAILSGVAGAMQNRQFPMEKESLHIGANPQNDLCIPDDDYVSGNHAWLRYEKGSIFVVDVGSRNGTFVNGQRVSNTARALTPGDRIQIGNTIFELHSGG
jgi:tetratricopeptide (TPR) repeat protein